MDPRFLKSGQPIRADHPNDFNTFLYCFACSPNAVKEYNRYYNIKLTICSASELPSHIDVLSSGVHPHAGNVGKPSACHVHQAHVRLHRDSGGTRTRDLLENTICYSFNTDLVTQTALGNLDKFTDKYATIRWVYPGQSDKFKDKFIPKILFVSWCCQLKSAFIETSVAKCLVSISTTNDYSN